MTYQNIKNFLNSHYYFPRQLTNEDILQIRIKLRWKWMIFEEVTKDHLDEIVMEVIPGTTIHLDESEDTTDLRNIIAQILAKIEEE